MHPHESLNRANFGSKIGAILAAAGSAVGLGNIWRFPYETGNHGGAAFIIIYIICVVVLGFPLMMAEFTIGRRSHASTGRSFEILAPGSGWRWLGYMGVLTGILILGYYSVVAGWTLEYIYQAGAGHLSGIESSGFDTMFSRFVANPIRPLVCLFLFMLLTHIIIVRGVKEGIERYSKIMMPALFVIVIVLAICSLLLPGAGQGLAFLLQPDFSKVTAGVVISAMGQAFFSLSIGMGCLSTYASYFNREVKFGHIVLSVGLIDTFVAILSGLIIFPAAFSVGIQPDSGPKLIFITLPVVFQEAFGGIPFLSYLVSVFFYVLLAIAALTSTISLHEVSTAFLQEKFSVRRTTAARIVTVVALLIGIVSSLSLGMWNDLHFAGMNIFDCFDYFTAKIMLPLGGLLTAIFVGWFLDKEITKGEITNYGRLQAPYFGVYIFVIRYLAPIGITLIFVKEIGLLG